MAAIQGLRGTGDWGTDERPKNFREYILWRNPNGTAPLHALTAKMTSESVDDPQFSWWEEENTSTRMKINYTTGYGTTATSLVVAALSTDACFVPGDVLYAESDGATSKAHELLIVTAVGAGGSPLTVTRGAGGSTPQDLAHDSALLRIGSVWAEGTGSPNTISRNPTKMHNFCQIFKTAYSLTNTTLKTKARTGDPLKNDKKRRMWDHSTGLEWAFWLGRRHEGTGSNGKPQRMTGGFLHMLLLYAANNYYSGFDTTITEDLLLDTISPIWDFDSGSGNQRIVFCGNGALNFLNKLARNSNSTRINFDGFVTTYGMRLQRWIFPQGELFLRTHPLFNTSGNTYRNYGMAILDPSCIRYRYMRDTTHQDNIQANDEDLRKGQWLTECGLEWHHLKTSMWVTLAATASPQYGYSES